MSVSCRPNRLRQLVAAVTALLQDFAKVENVEKPEFCMHRALLAGVQVPLRTLRFRQLFWATA